MIAEAMEHKADEEEKNKSNSNEAVAMQDLTSKLEK